jgi:hypothetical protein
VGVFGNALWLSNAAGQSHDPDADGIVYDGLSNIEHAIATDNGSGDILIGSSNATWMWFYYEDPAGPLGEIIFLENLPGAATAPWGANGTGYTIYQLPDDSLHMWCMASDHNAGVWTPNPGQWYHMAVTRTNTAGIADSYDWYIDGQLFGSGANTNSVNQAIDGGPDLWMGTRNPGTWGQTGNALNGGLDEVMIFKRALSQPEIMQYIPEPMTMCLLGLGGLALIRRRK